MRIMWPQRTKSGPLRLKYGTVYSSRISCNQTIALMKPLKPQTWVELLRTHTHAHSHARTHAHTQEIWEAGYETLNFVASFKPFMLKWLKLSQFERHNVYVCVVVFLCVCVFMIVCLYLCTGRAECVDQPSHYAATLDVYCYIVETLQAHQRSRGGDSGVRVVYKAIS